MMKNINSNKSLRFPLSCTELRIILLFLISLLSIPVFGQNKGPAIRSSLTEIITIFQDIGVTYNLEMVLLNSTSGLDYLQEVSDDDLAKLEKTLPQLMVLKEKLQKLQETLRAGLQRAERTTPPVESPGLPNAQYSNLCSSLTISTDAYFSATAVFFIAKGVRSAASRACEQTVVVLGEGGNTSLACIVVDTIFELAEGVFKEFEICLGDKDSAEINSTYGRTGHLHTDLENLTTDFENFVNEQKNAFEKFAEEQLRIEIEQTLAGHTAHPHAIALFELPSAFGGKLELVREIVEETINNMKAAGENVGDAAEDLTEGDEEYANGEYKDAFYKYSKAYRDATKR